MADDVCPYKVGDCVVYRPTTHGVISSIMNISAEPPKIGQAVKITRIVGGRYIQWEGYTHHSGGIYWTEFSAT
jgi:hypothetical protein